MDTTLDMPSMSTLHNAHGQGSVKGAIGRPPQCPAGAHGRGCAENLAPGPSLGRCTSQSEVARGSGERGLRRRGGVAGRGGGAAAALLSAAAGVTISSVLGKRACRPLKAEPEEADPAAQTTGARTNVEFAASCRPRGADGGCRVPPSRPCRASTSLARTQRSI